MKKATIQFTFDAEKLAAIQKYMQRKDISLQAELDDSLQKLYEKHVPSAVREYIESNEEEAQPTPSKPSRPSAAPAQTRPEPSPRPRPEQSHDATPQT